MNIFFPPFKEKWRKIEKLQENNSRSKEPIGKETDIRLCQTGNHDTNVRKGTRLSLLHEAKLQKTVNWDHKSKNVTKGQEKQLRRKQTWTQKNKKTWYKNFKG